jgi:2',3'-cyclic-nucleotide 2'-phosphodiesterase (5'-nucleotidase family)
VNDLHGRIKTLPLLAGYVANLRRARANDGAVVVVDSGDIFQGTLESNLTQGASVIAAYEALGVTAAALGNHEFDFGPAAGGPLDPQGALKQRLREANFPFLCANLRERATARLPRWENLKGSALIEVQGVKIGLIGALTLATPRIVMPRWFAGLEVTPLAPAIAEQASALRAAGASLVVLLAHAGAECASFDDPRDLSSCDDGEIFEVVRALPRGAVDAVFGGHTHAGVAHFVEGVAVVEAYAYGHAFSRIDFRIDRRSGRVLEVFPFRPHRVCALPPSETCAPGSYLGAPVEIDDRVNEAIAPGLARAAELRGRLLGVELVTPVLRAHGVESPLGNLFVDLIREAQPGSDVAIANGGSLRSDLAAGELTYGRLYESMPFDNHLASFEMAAGELAALLARHFANDDHGIVSLSGVRARAECGPAGLGVTLLRDGVPLASETRLRVVTSDYLATGGDALFGGRVPAASVRVEPVLLRDALAAGFQRHGGKLRGTDPRWFDPDNPRLVLPAPRPIHCTSKPN